MLLKYSDMNDARVSSTNWS